jgi:hypothetical protein
MSQPFCNLGTVGSAHPRSGKYNADLKKNPTVRWGSCYFVCPRGEVHAPAYPVASEKTIWT